MLVLLRLIKKNKLMHRTRLRSSTHSLIHSFVIHTYFDFNNRKTTKKKKKKNRAKISNYLFGGKCVVAKGAKLSS